MKNPALVFFLLLAAVNTVFAQNSGSYHTPYDDSTLGQQGPFTLMPFNRLVQSAGDVVTFGDPRQENHALDFALLPDGRHMAVEDRLGIAVLDIATRQIVHRWSHAG